MKQFSLVQFVRSVRWFSSNKSLKMEAKLKKIFLKSVDSVKPSVLISTKQLISMKSENGKEFLEIKNSGITERVECTQKRISFVGFGKAVYSLAVEVQEALGSRLLSGIISVPVGSTELASKKIFGTNIKVYEGAKNNLPDENAMAAAGRIKMMVEKLTRDDILIVLISGGGSGNKICRIFALIYNFKLI